jgi:hypothetical protein
MRYEAPNLKTEDVIMCCGTPKEAVIDKYGTMMQ